MSATPGAAKAENVKIVTLGCAKNEVDSEEIAGVLLQAGYTVDGSAKRSGVTVINTCGFWSPRRKSPSRQSARRFAKSRRVEPRK